jgi:hypothetical protein
MNLKTIGLNAAVATALVVGSSLAISPAQAATVGSRLDFEWFARTTLPGGIDFLGQQLQGNLGNPGSGYFAVQGTSTGSFSGLGSGTIKDLTASQLSSLGSGSTSVSNFLKVGSETFTLSKFNFLANNTISFEGLFGNGVKGIGSATYGSTFVPTVYQYSASVTAVPTPVLLPGLVALGVGVLRKRKAEATANDA